MGGTKLTGLLAELSIQFLPGDSWQVTLSRRKSMLLRNNRVVGIVVAFWVGSTAIQAQVARQRVEHSVGDAAKSDAVIRPGQYLLGPDDQVSIWALGAEEIPDRPFRIDPQGYLDLPMVGRVRCAGLTTEQLGAELSRKLAAFVKQPQVTVSIVELRSQPVSVMGAVGTPGVHQVSGRKTLIEVLSLAGGLHQDSGNVVKITRKLEWGRIPLASAVDDPSGHFSVADVHLKSLMEAERPEENIAIQPFDVITVPRANLFYVVGDVRKSGGFVFRERETISVLQAISTAEGLTPTASPSGARILRTVKGSPERLELPVDIQKIFKRKQEDIALQADDILYVPSSTGKKIANRAIEAGIGLGSGILIWRR